MIVNLKTEENGYLYLITDHLIYIDQEDKCRMSLLASLVLLGGNFCDNQRLYNSPSFLDNPIY